MWWPQRGCSRWRCAARLPSCICRLAKAGKLLQAGDMLQQTGEVKAVLAVGLQLLSPLEGAVNQGTSPWRPPDCLDFWQFVAVNTQLHYSI